MTNRKILVFVIMLVIIAGVVFAADVKVGKYVAGNSRNDLDHDYWIELRADNTVVWVIPGGTASGTWRYDGHTIYIIITTAYGEMAKGRGRTLEFIHADGTGNVLYGDDDAWWLQ